MINEFKLERYYAKYEFSAKYMFSSSDCEGLHVKELLHLASLASRDLWDNLSLGYTESQGLPVLRNEIAGTYDQIMPDQVLVCAPEEAIFLVMNSLLQPGEEIVVTFPGYQSLYEIARSIGCKVVPWQIELQGNRWQYPLDELKRLVTSRTKMIVVNFPHNPTGYIPSRAEQAEVIDIARSHNALLFSDEMYRMLEPDESIRLPAVCDIYENGISLSGLSKTYALPGLRMGWLASPIPGLPEKLLRMKDYTTICNSAPSEILALIALQNRGHILNRNLDIIRENARLAKDFFARYSSLFCWIPPVAGSVAFPLWLGDQPVDKFCLKVVEKTGVMIVPGSLFDYPGKHFRTGLGRKNFKEALQTLDTYLTEEMHSLNN